MIINIVLKEDNSYCVTFGNVPQCTCLDFTKMSFGALGKVGKWIYHKHLYDVFQFLCKVDHKTDKLIHAPTYTYNVVIQLLELAGVVVEHE